MLLSLVFPSLSESLSASCEPCLSGLPVPDSTFPAFPRSRGSASVGQPAAGGSSKLAGSGRGTLAAAAAHVLQAHGSLLSICLCPFIANLWVPVPSQQTSQSKVCYSLSNGLKIHLCLHRTAEAELLFLHVHQRRSKPAAGEHGI